MKTILLLGLLFTILSVASTQNLTYSQEQFQACKNGVVVCRDYLGEGQRYQNCVEGDTGRKYTLNQCVETIQEFVQNPPPVNCNEKNLKTCKKVSDFCHQFLGKDMHMLCFLANTDFTPKQCQQCMQQQEETPINGPCSPQDTQNCKNADNKCHRFTGTWTYQSCFNDKSKLSPKQCQKCIQNEPQGTIRESCTNDETKHCKKASNKCHQFLGERYYRQCFSEEYDKLSIKQCQKCIQNFESSPVRDSCNSGEIKTCKVAAMACKAYLGDREYQGCFDSHVKHSISLKQCQQCLRHVRE